MRNTWLPTWRGRQRATWTGPTTRHSPRGQDETFSWRRRATGRPRIRVDDGGRGHIYGVIGPDEYHEVVDDDAFTNVIARWNLRSAARAVANGPEDAARPEAARWLELAGSLVDGYQADTASYEQFAGFLGLEPLIIEDIAPRRPIAADLLLGADRVSASQVIKQADVLMLHHHMVPDEVAPRSLIPNLDFYEPRTAHGSSLSPGIHAAVFARAGRLDEALDALRLAASIDLEDLTGTTASGLHLATMGSVWQALAYGFAGIRPGRDFLYGHPSFPAQWSALESRFGVQGQSGPGAHRAGVHDAPGGTHDRDQATGHSWPGRRRTVGRAHPSATPRVGGDFMMNRVTAAIDNTAAAPTVLAAGTTIAELFEATLEAVHVRDDGARTARAAAAAAGLSLREVNGPVVPALVSEARRRDVAALVVGARATPAGRRPAGHIALDVITAATTPVAVVPPDPRRPSGLKRLLVPLDGTSSTARALEGFIEIACRHNVDVVVMHVRDEASLPPFSDQPQHEADAWERDVHGPLLLCPERRGRSFESGSRPRGRRHGGGSRGGCGCTRLASGPYAGPGGRSPGGSGAVEGSRLASAHGSGPCEGLPFACGADWSAGPLTRHHAGSPEMLYDGVRSGVDHARARRRPTGPDTAGHRLSLGPSRISASRACSPTW